MVSKLRITFRRTVHVCLLELERDHIRICDIRSGYAPAASPVWIKADTTGCTVCAGHAQKSSQI